MQIAIVKRRPKRRCRIPRRPHPDLDFFFGRYERADLKPVNETRTDVPELERQFRPQPRH
ncbi:hypothetical protein [Bradyrhizobium sp.]|uniref:hypothetical protein n=1 Tax=Bradyrhizobium sp. TaxID=376 RepID=UPI0023A4FBEA|nr:hypothetical protein [Bradyrhizobium sp.]MDE2376845.1 hypothetical protein [Bradyrhizobium sp.]